MSTENAQTAEGLTAWEAASQEMISQGIEPRTVRNILNDVAREAREAARAELESRFDPEARKLDRFVDGWLSAAEHLTKEPGL